MRKNIFFNFLLILFSFLGLKLIISIGLNNIADYLPITYCENTEYNKSDSNSINNTTNSISEIINNGTNIRHTLDVSPNLSLILNGFSSTIQNSISGYGTYQAANFVVYLYGKVAVFLGSFGFLTATQQIARIVMNRYSKPAVNVKSSIENNITKNNDLGRSADESMTAKYFADQYKLNFNESVTEDLKVSSENLNQNNYSLEVDTNSAVNPQANSSSDFIVNNSLERGDLNFIVNSVIETNDFDIILSGIIIYALTGLYVFISLGLGIISRELKLEEKDWIKSKPILLKLATLGKYSSRTVLLLLYFLTFLCLLGILLTSIYLKCQLSI